MRRDDSEVWAKRVARWEKSGKTKKDFAEGERVNPKTLGWWAWRLRQEKAIVRSTAGVEWLEVTPPVRTAASSDEPFEIVVGGLVIRVPVRFDAAALRQLLAVLGERS